MMVHSDVLRIVVVGTGYVGLTTGVALAYLGHQVIGVDKDSRKLERLQAGRSPIHEAGQQKLFSSFGNRVVFTDCLREAVGESIYKFARKMLQGEPIPIYGDGFTRRDYTYVDGVIEGVCQAMDYTATPYEVINLGK